MADFCQYVELLDAIGMQRLHSDTIGQRGRIVGKHMNGYALVRLRQQAIQAAAQGGAVAGRIDQHDVDGDLRGAFLGLCDLWRAAPELCQPLGVGLVGAEYPAGEFDDTFVRDDFASEIVAVVNGHNAMVVRMAYTHLEQTFPQVPVAGIKVLPAARIVAERLQACMVKAADTSDPAVRWHFVAD